MPSMKALKRRITSVNNTQQIMKAMKLVATSKVQKNKSRMEAVRPMMNAAADFMTYGIGEAEAAESEYYRTSGNSKNALYVVLSGERGLCGGYNANILKAALAEMESHNGVNSQVIAVGSTCKDYFVRRRKKVVANHVGVLEKPPFHVAEDIVRFLLEKFLSNDKNERADEIYIAYTKFETLLSSVPTVVRVLPMKEVPGRKGEPKEVIYEPDVHTYLKKSVPVYLAMFLYGAMVEASVCEQASRMTSMDSASRNAGEIVDNLTLQYNRQRQGAITQEISEIVGGANAV